jgi:hypothetical protein
MTDISWTFSILSWWDVNPPKPSFLIKYGVVLFLLTYLINPTRRDEKVNCIIFPAPKESKQNHKTPIYLL